MHPIVCSSQALCSDSCPRTLNLSFPAPRLPSSSPEEINFLKANKGANEGAAISKIVVGHWWFILTRGKKPVSDSYSVNLQTHTEMGLSKRKCHGEQSCKALSERQMLLVESDLSPSGPWFKPIPKP